MFGREPQRRTARHDDSQHGAALSQRRHFGCDSDDLLEVVQKQQGGPVADQGDEAVEERSFLSLLDVECGRERREERRRLGDVCERDERESVRELCCKEPSELDQHARLSDPAGTGDRDHPLRSHEIGERGELARTPDERHRRSGETARQAREALALSLERSRVRYHQAVGRHGKQFEGAPDVLEPEPPQRHGNNIASVLDLLVRRVRQQDAAWDGERLDPRSDVDGIARQPLRFDDHLTAVHADTNQHVLRRELLLDSYRCLDRGERAREHAHASVPEPLHDRPPERLVMTFERVPVPLSPVECETLVRLQQRGVPGHVREHHRDKATIERDNHDAILSALVRPRQPGTATCV